MCATCGCSDGAGPSVTDLRNDEVVPIGDASHVHSHPHHDGNEPSHSHDGHTHDGHTHDGHTHDGHTHEHDHRHEDAGRTVVLEQEVLAKNDLLAERNRGWLAGRGILALNLMSSPGAGKTTLLERTIREVGDELGVSVIEGDQETLLDAERIRATGCPVVQINTGSGCHLDAPMLAQGLERLDPAMGSVVMIENVGNLVCPALFDLGEDSRVVIMSVTEGEDKPLKYPHMFRSGTLLVLNKIDLAAHVAFDVDRCVDAARRVNPSLEVLQTSATTGQGLDAWYGWLRSRQAALV